MSSLTTTTVVMYTQPISRYEIEGCEIVWVVKDSSISKTFVDPGAAEFFLSHINKEKQPKEGPLKRPKYTLQGM